MFGLQRLISALMLATGMLLLAGCAHERPLPTPQVLLPIPSGPPTIPADCYLLPPPPPPLVVPYPPPKTTSSALDYSDAENKDLRGMYAYLADIRNKCADGLAQH